MRNSFVFYGSWWEAIKNLPRDVQGDVLTAIIEYGLTGETTGQLKPIAKAMLAMAKSQIDINNQRFENGKKGGRPNQVETKEKPKGNQTGTKVEPNVNDNVNDNNYPPISPPKGGQDLNPDEDTLSEREAELNAREQELLKREAALKAKEGTKLPDTSFVSDDFKDIFETWLKYKQEKRESYKSKKSLQACYKKLLTLSGNDPDTARNVVEQSMANNWSGLFGLTGNNHGTANRSNYTSKQEANAYALERLQQHKLDLEAGLADQVERPF